MLMDAWRTTVVVVVIVGIGSVQVLSHSESDTERPAQILLDQRDDWIGLGCNCPDRRQLALRRVG